MADLELAPNLLATPHRFLLHTPTNTAILSDIHLGYEQELARQGLARPAPPTIPINWQPLSQRLAEKPNPHLMIAGDLFDSPNPTADILSLARTMLTQLPARTQITTLPSNHTPH